MKNCGKAEYTNLFPYISYKYLSLKAGNYVKHILELGHIAQLVAHQTQEPEVPGSSGHILSFLLLLIQGQLSVTGESMCMKYWLTA